MKFALSSLLLISALTFSLAKEETAKETTEAAKVETDKDEAISEPLIDGSGAKSEGGSSDFDIEQLLKLIDALKNEDYDGVDKALKDSEEAGLKFKKMDHLPEEKIVESDSEKSKKEAPVAAAAASSSSSEMEDEMAEFAKMEL